MRYFFGIFTFGIISIQLVLGMRETRNIRTGCNENPKRKRTLRPVVANRAGGKGYWRVRIAIIIITINITSDRTEKVNTSCDLGGVGGHLRFAHIIFVMGYLMDRVSASRRRYRCVGDATAAKQSRQINTRRENNNFRKTNYA